MIDINQVIRIEKRTYPSRIKTGRSPYNVYIFKCRECVNEIKSGFSYLKKHSGLCIHCANKISLQKALKKRRLRPYESILNVLKVADNKCNLTYEDFLEFTKTNNCHYCTSQINWIPFGKATTHNLDRKDNNKAHIKGNLVVCCGSCNRTKGPTFSYDEFILLSPILTSIMLNRINKNVKYIQKGGFKVLKD